MYPIRQFKPMLYAVLLLGLTGFCMAARTPGLWAFAALGIALNAWLVKADRFRPFPRWLANAATLLAVAITLIQLHGGAGVARLLIIGQFLVLLQLIKLFEQRANRDYAQLLVLSLLLMVAASMAAPSLLFGVLMVVYLVLSLYCCLAFHLKVEVESARQALAIPDDKVSRSTLRHDERFFARSLRRMTAILWLVSVSTAVLVFLFFPRGPGPGIFGQFELRGGDAMTGIQESVRFGQIQQIRQNDEVIAHVHVWRNGRAIAGSERLYLRGATHDTYARTATSAGREQWLWTRRPPAAERPSIEHEMTDSLPFPANPPTPGDLWRQRIVLQPTSTRMLFALPGLLSYAGSAPAFRSARPVGVRYFRDDRTLQTTEKLASTLDYEVISCNQPLEDDIAESRRPPPDPPEPDAKMRQVMAEIRRYTLAPGVVGDLAASRPAGYSVDAGNEAIARRIEDHLRNQFAYTLDLRDSRDKFKNADPMVAFLTTVKKGHCEYFASAMTLMCQSVGVPARMVVGFKADPDAFNPLGGYYIVRQAHAHAWVEVLTWHGRDESGRDILRWTTFDPTSGREAQVARAATLWDRAKHLMDYLEYKWAEKVIGYDHRDRDNILRAIDYGLMKVLTRVGGILFDLKKAWAAFSLSELMSSPSFWQVALNILVIIVSLLVAALVLVVVAFFIQRYRLRRRAERMGIESLPPDQQRRLARQLAFYDQLAVALLRRGLRREPHQTPREFAASLCFLPPSLFASIRRLTELFYGVRYGNTRLNATRQRRLERAVSRLSADLRL